ncbi:DUF2795 domain-containing protein [Ralstonia sp. R-29]|uniref:DUF2795 domain-containing protein n=1 Tax=Ralstonia sp. R-29 TaxID=3404059 RepID=UPI003CFAF43D
MKSTHDKRASSAHKHAPSQSTSHSHATGGGKPDSPSKTKQHSGRTEHGGHGSTERSGAKSHERGTHSGGQEHATHSPIGIQKALKGASYPAKKQDLLDTAQANGADDSTLQTLRDLPDNEYDTPAAVSKAVGKEM